MGRYDDPANIDLVTAQTGHEKIFYIGYSQGTLQMIYGLAHLEDSYHSKHLLKAVLLAPCAILSDHAGITDKDGKPDIDYYVKNDFRLQELGVYAVHGPHWVRDLATICEHLSHKMCAMLTAAGEGIEPYSVQNELLLD